MYANVFGNSMADILKNGVLRRNSRNIAFTRGEKVSYISYLTGHESTEHPNLTDYILQ